MLKLLVTALQQSNLDVSSLGVGTSKIMNLTYRHLTSAASCLRIYQHTENYSLLNGIPPGTITDSHV